MKGIEHLFWDDIPDEDESKRTTNLFGEEVPKRSCVAARPLVPNCRHWRQRFDLEKSLHVFASAWLDEPSTESSKHQGFSGKPDIGFNLDTRWATKSLLVSPGFRPPFTKGKNAAHVLVYPWEDGGVPENPQLFRRALRWLLAEGSRGKTIEIACMGGHGRTGTTLACLLVVQGLTPSHAAERVWSRYCEKAIESRNQLDFIRSSA